MNGNDKGASLPIIEFPDSRLRQKSVEVSLFNEELRCKAETLIRRMREERGVGLAAIQVGWPIRLLILDCEGAPADFSGKPMAICNPEVIKGAGVSDLPEGCLSAPGLRERLGRFDRVEARWQTVDGERATGVFEGLAAVCLQHEMDHLDGKLFFERLSPLKANRARERYFKLKRAKGEHHGS